jgi:AhpD family alkylhydroperoxidase
VSEGSALLRILHDNSADICIRHKGIRQDMIRLSQAIGVEPFEPQGRSIMRALLASVAAALVLASATQTSVSAQEAPAWMKQTLPDQALKPLWDEYLAIMNPAGALDGKTKQLIALGVAAQIPCAYCVFAHTKAAKAAGATDAQIKEAVATASLVRFNSTMLNGSDGGREWLSH